MALRMANIDYHTRIAAPFVTTEIFVQGCNVTPKCAGCWNKALWDIDGPARVFEPGELAELLIRSVPYKRLTICGGEPFLQAGELAQLASILKQENFFIMAYSGWTWEELLEGKAGGILPDDAFDFLSYLDVLVDGRYIPSQRNPKIGQDFEWVGSTNQRLIDVPASLHTGSPVVIDTFRVMEMAGLPSPVERSAS